MRASRIVAGTLLIAVVAFAAGFAPNKPKEIERVGMVVGIDPEQIDKYKRLAIFQGNLDDLILQRPC